MEAEGLEQDLMVPNGHAFMIPNGEDEGQPGNFRRILENRLWRTIVTMIIYTICVYVGSYVSITDSLCVVVTVILHIAIKIYFTVYRA